MLINQSIKWGSSSRYLQVFVHYNMCKIHTLFVTGINRRTGSWSIERIVHLINMYIIFSSGASNRFRVMAFPYGTSWSHSDTPPSVGLLCTSDQPDPVILPDNTQHSQQTDIHAPCWIRTHNPKKRVAADSRLRTRFVCRPTLHTPVNLWSTSILRIYKSTTYKCNIR